MDISVFHNLPPMMDEEPFPRVLYVKIFRNYFAFDIINKMRYILCVEALLEAWTSPTKIAILAWILPRIRNQVQVKMVILTCKITPAPGIEPATSRSAVERSTD